MQRIIMVTGVVVLAAVGYLLAQGEGERGRRPPMEIGGPPPRPEGHRSFGPPPHEGPREHGPHRSGPGGEHGPPGPPPQHPLELVLDSDDDGIISVKELENAAASLRKLDRNNDGQLSEREYRPRPPFGQPSPHGGPPPHRPEDSHRPTREDASEKSAPST